MDRVLADSIQGKHVFLAEEEIHHLVRVRRTRRGQEFEALDGRGKILICRLLRSNQAWYGEIVEELSLNRESPLRLTLAQALLKKDRFEWVIQKAAELGVSEIVPLVTERTEVELDEMRQGRKQQRWQRILREAVKQSGRGVIPTLAPIVELKEFLKSKHPGMIVVLDEAGGERLHSVLAAAGKPVTECLLLVGPEGGWDAADRDRIRAAGIRPVQLGPRILRAETAPLAAISILQYEIGDLG